MKQLYIFLFLIVTSIYNQVDAQVNANGTIPCVDSIIYSIKEGTSYSKGSVYKFEKELILESQGKKYTFGGDNILNWYKSVAADSIKVFRLNHSSGNSCFLLRSSYLNATGLGSNFTTWIFFDDSTNSISFESLSQNPGLIYFDPKTSKLKFIRITYGDQFFWNRDWNKIDYKLETNEINNGSNQIINSKISWCR